jgi:hypothetical protein
MAADIPHGRAIIGLRNVRAHGYAELDGTNPTFQRVRARET